MGALVRRSVAARGEAELDLGDAAAARRSLARALDRNPESWSAWFDLAVASNGSERELALDRAAASIRAVPRSINSEQNLNECARRGLRAEASTHQRMTFGSLRREPS